ncbi:glutathione S-transferase N-terminal domain-containing protein [Geminicoccus harenae]|uniref:glutathione S-transferase N-terminal domain-containing protein n=1 Tax=Geminicoccus harenae TaxID=2498453 RepID=UPI001C97C314|nr:glutathione S-transferase N-terminal domain-containing protein [Geminicoccus harenae]
MTTRLVIGSRNACGGSLAAWLAMRTLGLRFEEVLVPLGRPETEELLERFTAHGRLPVLVEPEATVSGVLPILEWLAERHPELWPDDPAERALARSVASELLDGLDALHRFLPMDLIARFGPPGRLMRGVASDLKRVRQIWTDLRTGPVAARGPFLFGRFTAVDAVAAPIVTRFVTYALPPQDPACAAYVAAVAELAPLQEWAAEAVSEVAAFERIRAEPFHRRPPEPIPALVALLTPAGTAPLAQAPAGTTAPATTTAHVPAAPAPAARVRPETAARGTASGASAETAPPPGRSAVPGPRLDEVDRPPIAYLDDPAPARSPLDATALSTAREPLPDPAAPAPRPPMSGTASPGAGGPAGMAGQPDAPRDRVAPAPPAGRAPAGLPPGPGTPGPGAPWPRPQTPDARVPGQGGTAAAGGSGTDMPGQRLRRPGAAGADAATRPDNRFARALSGGRERPAEPEPGRPAALRPGTEAPAARPRSDTAGQERSPAEAGPVPPRTIRPSVIKPIGYSGQRRR